VTGANTGIGQAIAVGLAQAGGHVICAGRRSCDETIELIKTSGGTAETVLVDFADPMAGQGLFAGRDVDILVNNAGIIRRADAVDFTEEDWDAVMDVNLKALFFTTQAFAKDVLARDAKGAVVNIASLLSFQGGIRVPSYTACQISGQRQVSFTSDLARSFVPLGVSMLKMQWLCPVAIGALSVSRFAAPRCGMLCKGKTGLTRL